MIDTSLVTLEIRGHIAYVTLSRPEKHNGLNMEMIQAIISTASRIRRDRRIRCVIISGQGESFCAGLDFKALTESKTMAPRLFLKWPWKKANAAQHVNQCWRDLPVPVISVIHGNCFGAAMQLILATDYRIARPDANLSIMEIKWGLIPDMSGAATLSRLTSVDVAQELTWTGRQFSGTEAKALSLVSRLSDDPMAEAESLANSIADQSPDAISAAKVLFNKTWQAGTWKALFWERWIQARILFRKNNRIALKNGFRAADEKIPYRDRRSFR
ncbi:crotonase/enoyl-CoA hydratase family protein [Saccharospirillum salsuginis]|uniref:Enoyl-CoA hydratase/isomerase family protein n=1 Tax=Saccharospirillum salsuginis TaxID=418750 RepID=A0A918N522_9GAMM|nr:crotonase/enoyl-CoA hydratase family protein [Saccharospirillum salsuginis]GGX40079.1 enoyl-CoA hydratase/isomerase family protein [Saccharospirillum salsuginis]